MEKKLNATSLQNVSEVFVDALDATLMGPTITKLIFRKTSGLKDVGVQLENEGIALIIPTVALLRTVLRIQESIDSNSETLLEGISATKQGVESMLIELRRPPAERANEEKAKVTKPPLKSKKVPRG